MSEDEQVGRGMARMEGETLDAVGGDSATPYYHRKLARPWNKAEVGTGITTDPKAAGEMGWQLVDDARFDALEQGGFFGDYKATANMGGDITGSPILMDEPPKASDEPRFLDEEDGA